jgi:DNA-binding response OmpR family regulator
MSNLLGKCILVLEHDAEIATQLVLALEAAGADVVYTANALQALDRLTHFHFNAAVIDCFDSAENWKRIAARLQELNVPFCALSRDDKTQGAPVVRQVEQVVPALVTLLTPRMEST